jgi:hypothetical protein
MNKITNKMVIHYGVPVILFFFISVAYFIPDVLEGKKLNQHDIMQFKGMSKEISDYREKYHEEPLWTNSMYGGMPAYLISTKYKGNVLKQIHSVFTLFGFRPVSFVFLYLLGAYLALLLIGVNPWLSFAGALAYGFSAYFFQIIQVGHVSKVLALGYMPPVIAGVYIAFRGKHILGSLCAGLFLGLQILMNHIQITYYTFLIILILGIVELVIAIKNKTLAAFLKPFPWLILCVVLAVGANFSSIYTTYEYGKYSIRGPTELSSEKANRTSGLDKDYATQYSYSPAETFNLMIPNFMGGSSGGELKESSHTYKFLKSNYGNPTARNFIKAVPLYWGDQIQTAGPVYIGAVVVFLFILGLFLVRGPARWWLGIVTVFAIFLAWGDHFKAFNYFMLDFFPGYNKFRTVSMTLTMVEFTMPFMAILVLREIIFGEIPKKEFMRALKYSFFGLGGLIVFLILIAGSFDMSNPYDSQRLQGIQGLIDAIELDRLSILRTDAVRSLILISLAAALVYFTWLKKLKFNMVIVLLSLLILVDLWPVDKRYLNSSNFMTVKEDKNVFKPTTADMVILNDKDPDYRVLNVSLSPLQDATTSYYHKSIGGYHGAKMRRFQELYDNNIQKEILSLYNTLQQKTVTMESIDSTLARANALNILNTRYIIVNPDAPPLVNKYRLGNAWFVDEFRVVANADEEIKAVSDIDPARQAVVDNRFSNLLEGFKPEKDSSAGIKLVEYRPNYLKYSSTSQKEQLAVFSEVYYDKGWQAYIDNKPAPYFRADYLLRAMRIPSGNHVIEFRFHPSSYYVGEKISLASSLILILLLVGTAWFELKKKKADQ